MSTPSLPRACAVLPLEYSPSPHTVVLGKRGKQARKYKGNLKLEQMVLSELPSYTAARNKNEKSQIIQKLIAEIKEGCPDGFGFVRQNADLGRWFVCESQAARVAVAQTFRDQGTESMQYRSSKLRKRLLRQEKKRTEAKSKAIQPQDTGFQLSPVTISNRNVVCNSFGAQVPMSQQANFSLLLAFEQDCRKTAKAEIGEILYHMDGIPEDHLSFTSDPHIREVSQHDWRSTLFGFFDVALAPPNNYEDPFEPIPLNNV